VTYLYEFRPPKGRAELLKTSSISVLLQAERELELILRRPLSTHQREIWTEVFNDVEHELDQRQLQLLPLPNRPSAGNAMPKGSGS
jgi:hypothetical protein